MGTAAGLPALLAVSAAFGLGCTPKVFEESSGAKLARELEPTELEATPTQGGAIGTARVRVYVDDGYKAQSPDASTKIRLLFQRVNRVLEPTTGLRFEAVDIRPWTPSGDGLDLQRLLDELVAHDPATDVDFVFGMVDALNRASTDLHELGRAQILGRHAVVRGLADAVEVAALAKGLRTLGDDDRQALHSRRKRHKEEAIILHEIGHLLGAPHVTGATDLMSPSYGHHQKDFARDMADLMRQVARARMERKKGVAAREWAKALALMRAHTAEDWNEDEKGLIEAALQALAQGGDEGPIGEILGEGVRAADREKFRAAERLLAAGQPDDAWEELEPLLDFYPEEPAVNRLACRLAASSSRDRSVIEQRCKRAAQAAPGDGEPHLRLAQAYHAAGDGKNAVAEARAALAAIEKAAAAPAGKDADAAQEAAARTRLAAELAALFRALGAVTWTERAAALGGKPKELVEWARATRVRFAMPAGGPVPPEREAEYVAGLTAMLEDVYGRKFAEADRKAARLDRQFPRAAGVQAVRCDLEIRRNRYPEARARCREALRRDDAAAWAHYLIALLDKREKRLPAAAQHLERAIALDPTLKHAYQVAGQIYGQLGRAADHKRIADAYQARFNMALPAQ